MSIPDQKHQLAQAVSMQLRYASANSVMFSQAIAEQVRLASTDIEALDFLVLYGPSTAGQLANLTGLTSGAVTAVIDRLEKAGLVKREHSQQDRRKVIVIPNEAKIMAELAPYWTEMGEGIDRVCAKFSEQELEIILKFSTAANAVAGEAIAKIRAKTR